MNFYIKTLCLGASVAMAASSASALVLDLTTFKSSTSAFNSPVPSSGSTTSVSGTVGSLSWTLASAGGTLTYGSANNFNGQQKKSCQNNSGLTCDFDGVGIAGVDDSDDEQGLGEQFTLSFGSKVRITDLYFLDMYIPESVQVAFDDVMYAPASADAKDNLAGFTSSSFSPQSASKITFFTSGADDDDDIDFALAGVNLVADPDNPNEPDVVPLPAGGALLLGGLAGLGFLRRRRKDT